LSKSQAIFPAANAIESYRNSGYRHTASAIAELIDNSFDANAKNVWIVVKEGVRKNAGNETRCIDTLYVIDDGEGMDTTTMVLALQFGGGTQQDRKGLGRFGMGLPNASVSQCKNIQIFSAEKENKYYTTYLDVEEIKNGKMEDVPKPEHSDIKELTEELKAHVPIPKKGTVVCWSKIDRFDIRRTTTLFGHLCEELGRRYRYFLDKEKRSGVPNKKLNIKLVSLDDQTFNREVLPVDPLFLMLPSQAPQIDGHDVEYKPKGGDHHLKVPFPTKNPIGYLYFKFSKAPKKVRHEGGSSQFGKFAADQMGISVLRNWREIDFDDFNIFVFEPRDRWWGAEVNFDTSLDELMGVNYLKQGVRFKATEPAEDKFSENITTDLWATITNILQEQISPLRDEIRSESKTRDSETKDGKATKIATKVILEGTKNPLTKIESDKEKKNPEQIVKQVAKALGEDEKDPEVLTRIRDMVEKGFNFHLRLDSWEGPHFLSVKREGSQCIVKLNQSHRFFTDFYEPAWNSADAKTIDALDLLFLSFIGAQEADHLKRDYYDHVREKWGEKLRDFLKELNDGKK
jgi:hypothetical protein